MTWNSGSCVTPGDKPDVAVRAIHEAEILADQQPDEPGPGAARWPGHEIADDEMLERLRDGIGEL